MSVVHHAEMHIKKHKQDPCATDALFTFKEKLLLEVRRSRNCAVRVVVLVERVLKRRRVPLLPPDAIVLRVEELVVLDLLPPLAAPETPGYHCKGANENRATDAADYATDDVFA